MTTRRRALALVLTVACALALGCHREYTTHEIPTATVQRTFTRPRHDAVLITDSRGQRLRLSPTTTVRIVHHSGGIPRKAAWLRASELTQGPRGLDIPGEGTVAWQDIDALETRRIDKAKTLFWLAASIGLVTVCALYDCFGRVPR